ncbi:MAG TPA: hypothetical protein VEB86_08820 [Chryseosolibacter sp.]|nr:hypothetical protein [Chryseosolibacter sp.]
MKTRVFSLILAFLTVCASVLAQDYSFKVLAAKGSNEVKSGGAWQPLKTGASLKKDDEIKVGENSYIGLVSVKGKPKELKIAKVYKVAELEQEVGGGQSVLNKYTDFILSSNSAEAKKNRLSATGAVHRDVVAASIQVYLPENQYSDIFNNTAVVTWESAKVAGPYVVTLRNMFDDELGRIETPENRVVINMQDSKYASEEAILVTVKSATDEKMSSKQYLIKKLAPVDQEKIVAPMSEVGDVSEQSALNKYLLAGFYEQHNLLIDAIAAYEEAIALEPEVPTYKESYEEFLTRIGLKK